LALPSIPLVDITPSPTNPRKHFDEGALAELAATIKDHGVIQPITVRPNPKGEPLYEIVVGERRWRASRLAGMTDIPAFWRELTDQQVLEIQIIENLQRNDVHPLEEAEGYRLLMEEHGYTVEQIANKIGKDLQKKSYVYARLKLLDLCQEARNIMFERKLDASTALLIARIPTPGLQKQALKQIAVEGAEPMSYRAAKNHIQHNFTISLKQATFSLTDASLVETVGSCQDCTKRSGNAPELFGDTDDADVCSDTKCFDAKKAAKQQKLIDEASANSIPILRGDDAKAVMPWGRNTLDDEKYIDLDDVADGDVEERTYREILGDTAPVSALIESNGHQEKGILIEVAEPSALAEALQKAGWKPQEQPEENTGDTPRFPTVRVITPEQIEAEHKEREAKERENKIESAWRERLIDQCLFTLPDTLFDQDTLEKTIKIFAGQWVDMEAEFSGIDEDLVAKYGHHIPEECDQEEAAATLIKAMQQWDLGKVITYLFESIIRQRSEKIVGFYWKDGQQFRDQPNTTMALAEFLGIDHTRIRAQVVSEINGDSQPKTNGNPSKKPKKTTKSTPSGLAETAPTPKMAAPAARIGDAEDGLEARPNIRYALWGSAGWITWSGKGKKPAWIEQWLANGKTLEDLEAKADPAPAAQANENPTSDATGDNSGEEENLAQAAPGNESPVATGADSTNGDLFGQVSGDWPQPNEHGVYAADQAELITIDTKKAKIEGYVLQIGAESWIWAVDTTRKGATTGGSSSPLTAHQVTATRDGAIAIVGQEASQHVYRWIDSDGINADFKRIKAWADELLVNGENAECLAKKPEEKKATISVPVSEWPFPTGSRP
jgi:ParB/RepB/Spo0J family partition protein